MTITQSLSSFDVFPTLTIGITTLTGDDNKKFLQGQLTCDLDQLSPQHSILGAHCDPKGKMLAIVRLLQIQDTVLALQSADNVSTHLPSLKKYAVFSKVDIDDATSQYQCTGLSGTAALTWANTLSEQQLSAEQDTISTDIGLVSSFPLMIDDTPRLLIISTTEQHERLQQRLDSVDSTTQSNDLWFALETLSATPSISPNQQGDYVPQMLNMQMIEGINFKKGCYIGQETVARMHFRGLNKRAMFVLSASSHISCNVGDSLEKQIGENWRNAGTLVSVNHLAGQTIACAVLPTDIELDCPLRVKNNPEQDTFAISAPGYFESNE